MRHSAASRLSRALRDRQSHGAGAADLYSLAPDSREEWTSKNPSRDQCGMTALVVQDVLGGDLIIGEVHVEGVQIGHHYWNRLPDGSELDLTRDQFRPDEQVVGAG